MKLLIVGSRSIKEFDLSPHISEETEVILSGGAMGIDRLAEEYADQAPSFKNHSPSAFCRLETEHKRSYTPSCDKTPRFSHLGNSPLSSRS